MPNAATKSASQVLIVTIHDNGAPGRFPPACGCGGAAENSQGQNLLDDAHGFSAALDAIIGLPVIRQALLVEFTKTRLIAEERPVAHEYTALQKVFRRAIQPDDHGPGAALRRAKFADERGVARLRERAAAERQNQPRVPLRRRSQNARQAFVFDVAKHRFAFLRENL